MPTPRLRTALLALAVVPMASAWAALPEKYVPADTVVAVLPCIYTAGKHSEKDVAELTELTRSRLADAFSSRGFKLADPAAVAEALKRLNIDLKDEEQQKRETLYRVGDELKARLVAFCVITDVDSRVTSTFWAANKEGRARVKAWLVDADAKEAVFSAASVEGKAKKVAFTGVKATARMREAVCKAVDAAYLKPFLANYKETSAGATNAEAVPKVEKPAEK